MPEQQLEELRFQFMQAMQLIAALVRTYGTPAIEVPFSTLRESFYDCNIELEPDLLNSTLKVSIASLARGEAPEHTKPYTKASEKTNCQLERIADELGAAL